jgi:hypothetical protein
MEEKVVICCSSCRAEIRLRLTEQNLAIRFCPKCGAPVQPKRSQAWDASVVHEQPAPPEQDLMEDEPRQLPKTTDSLPIPFAPEDPGVPQFDLSIEAKPPPKPPPAKTPPPKQAPWYQDEAIPMQMEAPAKRPRVEVDVSARTKEDIVSEKRERMRQDHGGSLAGRPLWDAVYTFPFRLHNLRVFVILLIGLMLLALLAAGLHGLYEMMFSTPEEAELSSFSGLVHRGALHVFVCMFVLTVFVSLHQAAIFLRIIEDTAAGIDEVAWPRDPWFENFMRWLYLAWVFAVSAAGPAFFFFTVSRVLRVHPAIFWIATLTFAWLIFPIVLLSTLSANAFYMLLHPPMLLRLAKKPLAAGFLYMNALMFVFPCAILGYAVIGEYHFWLLPVLGVIWTIALLVYARALGRVGFELIQD